MRCVNGITKFLEKLIIPCLLEPSTEVPNKAYVVEGGTCLLDEDYNMERIVYIHGEQICRYLLNVKTKLVKGVEINEIFFKNPEKSMVKLVDKFSGKVEPDLIDTDL